jgi:hypothetical protein
MSAQPTEVPDRAWKLIEQTSWTQGCNARDEQGYGVEFEDPKACAYCTVGAIFKTYFYYPQADVLELLNRVQYRIGSGQPVVKWNDTIGRTKPEVVSILKELDI